MTDAKCPGQNPQYWKPEDTTEVTCPNCKEIIEFFKDEPKRKCHNCKQEVINPNVDFGCALWCPKAIECIGKERYQQLVASAKKGPAQDKYKTKKELLILEMEKYFGPDQKRINHAKKVLGFAEQLLEKENADPLVVIAASVLHDIGIHKAEEKYKSSAGNYQEIEGPPIARGIMEKLHLKNEVIEEVCEIIAHHHSPGEVNTLNFRVLYDSDWLVNLKDEFDAQDKERLDRIIEKVFLTNTGKDLARRIYTAGSSAAG
ncbi:HD domain-containing protein [bacterium]|nr:MAG: HD domain-containing protein [bacterium]